MKITPVQLAERVEAWQKRLAPLGVAHWTIEKVILCDETPSGPNANATVNTSPTYDYCTFWFRADYVEEATADELDNTIIHEWMHVAMRDLDEAIAAAEDQLSPGFRDAWEDRVGHEREGLVDRLALSLMLAHKRRKPRFQP